MSGQVIFQSFGRNYSDDDAAIGMHLLTIGVAICLFFSLCNLRINMGTRAEYTGTRLLPLFHDGAIAYERYRVVRQQEEGPHESQQDANADEAEDDVDSDGASSEEDSLEMVQVL
ncbi:MAG: hypothetical protein SGILL_002224 [Bacillariaceae sp.]